MSQLASWVILACYCLAAIPSGHPLPGLYSTTGRKLLSTIEQSRIGKKAKDNQNYQITVCLQKYLHVNIS